MKTLSEFKKKYNAEILSSPLESYRVGYKAEWQNLWGKQVEINNYFITDLLHLPEDKETLLENHLEETAKADQEDANMSNITFEGNNEINLGLNIPSFGINLSNKLDVSKILNFSYEGVKARTLKNPASSILVTELVKIKNNDNKKWRKINGFWFIETLYYASNVKISTESSYTEEITAQIKQPNIDVNLEIAGGGKTTILISGKPNVPFACKIEKIADYAK